MTKPRPQKSTTVRSLRLLMRVGERVAPALAARLANRLWFRIPVRSRPTLPPEGGAAFEVVSQGRRIRGRVWGEGPVVYLVHGWGGRGTDLAAFVEPLVARGRRVVTFDGPSHGASDPGQLGPDRAHGVEFGHALDAVFARFGPADAVVAHSMGSIATLLTLKYGWLSADRLALIAPMGRLSEQLSGFCTALAVGPRTRRRMEDQIEDLVRLPVREFDTEQLLGDIDAPAVLVVHDEGDRVTPYEVGRRIAAAVPTGAIRSTTGLGHYRLLRDAATVEHVVDFLTGRGEGDVVAA